jgi:hypothetical protein
MYNYINKSLDREETKNLHIAYKHFVMKQQVNYRERTTFQYRNS